MVGSQDNYSSDVSRCKQEISKWQQASVESTKLRFQLSNILDKFTDSEKQTIKYNQLLETIYTIFDHVLGDYRREHEIQKEQERKEQEERIRKELKIYKSRSKLFSVRTLWITLIGAAVAEIGKQIVIHWPQILNFIINLF
jgi:hypothetical protein